MIGFKTAGLGVGVDVFYFLLSVFDLLSSSVDSFSICSLVTSLFFHIDLLVDWIRAGIAVVWNARFK